MAKKNYFITKLKFFAVWFVVLYFSLWLLFLILFYLSRIGQYKSLEEIYNVGIGYAYDELRISFISISIIFSIIFSYKEVILGKDSIKKLKQFYNKINKNKKYYFEKGRHVMLDHLKDSNKLNALYILWATVHLIFFVTSGNFISYYGKFLVFKKPFYPFSQYSNFEDYDISEFIVYLIIPVAIYFFIKLWKNKTKESKI